MTGPAHRRRRTRLLTAFAVALALVGVALAFAAARNSPSPAVAQEDAKRARATSLPEPVEPAFVPGSTRPLGSQGDVSWYSPVRRATIARAAPDPAAAPVAAISPRTPEGTRNIVLVLARSRDDHGRLWIRVRLAVLPNGATGWVERGALRGYVPVRTRLVVDLGRLTATLYRDGRPIFEADVGIGRLPWPTPPGEFYVRNKLTRYADPFYGPLAFGTSARSAVLTDWPAGGFVGIHGTNSPELLPGRVSHGCIRMRNEDVLELGRLMPVGTPLTIR
jgi:lipoprotein-anchoring transpeptidase ErfK/SrfK